MRVLRAAEVGVLVAVGVAILLLATASVLHLRAGGSVWLVLFGVLGLALYGAAAVRTARWSRAVADSIRSARPPADSIVERRWGGIAALSIFAVLPLSFAVLWPFRDSSIQSGANVAHLLVALAPSALAGVVMQVAKQRRPSTAAEEECRPDRTPP